MLLLSIPKAILHEVTIIIYRVLESCHLLMVTLNEWLGGFGGMGSQSDAQFLQSEARRVRPRAPTTVSTELWIRVSGLSPGLHTNSMNLDKFINHLCLLFPIWERRIVTVPITRVVVKIKGKTHRTVPNICR